MTPHDSSCLNLVNCVQRKGNDGMTKFCNGLKISTPALEKNEIYLLQVGDVSFSFRLFENVVKYFDAFLNLIPLSFVLGFYVSYVASRKAISF
jgi:hypothetical protein